MQRRVGVLHWVISRQAQVENKICKALRKIRNIWGRTERFEERTSDGGSTRLGKRYDS
ncbi:MAG: hypothetical protein LBD43_02025 [Holosporales bacterium]|nr:hypothetical protein [Holosporales bacterium]